MQHVSMDQIVENFIRESERQVRRRLPACSLACGEVVDRTLNIVDLQGLSFRALTHTMAKKVVKEIMGVSQNHYPEMMGQTVVINCPTIFTMAWSSLKSMLDENTIRKIQIHTTNGSRNALLELVDAEQLPAFLGGKCECKCEGGCLASNIGPWERQDIQAYLASDPQNYWKALSPEGARALLAAEVAAKEEAAPEPGAAAEAAPEAKAAAEEVDEFEAVSPMAEEELDVKMVPVDTPAQQELRRLSQQYQELEKTHLQTLTDWVHFYREFVAEAGRHIVERAQSFYDARSVKAQLQREVATATSLCARLTEQFAQQREHHRRLEESFSAYMVNPQADTLSDAEWTAMCPDPPETPAEFNEDGKLIRAWRMATLSDRMAVTQCERDRAQLNHKRVDKECGDASERFEAEEAKHQFCTWNCSVQRSEAFYDRREAHEAQVYQQMDELQRLEEKVAAARLAVEAEGAEVSRVASDIGEGPRASSSPPQLTKQDLTPADYEIADFYSCSSGEESDDDKTSVSGDRAR